MIRIENANIHPYDLSGYRIIIGNMFNLATKHIHFALVNILPSTSLLQWDDNNSEIRFHEFKNQYIKELNSNPYTANFIKSISNHANNLLILYQNSNQIKIAKVLKHYISLFLGIPPVLKMSTSDKLLNSLYNTNIQNTLSLNCECEILNKDTKYAHRLHLSTYKNYVLYRGHRIKSARLRTIILKNKKRT